MTKEEYEKEKQEALKRRHEKFTALKGTFAIEPAPKDGTQKTEADISAKK